MIKSDTYLISVLQASKATGFPIRKWIQWILLGLITSEPELNEDYIKGIPYVSTASNVFIPITALPKYYREAYLRKTLIADSYFSVDFIGYLESNGSSAFSRLLDELSAIKQAVLLQNSSCTCAFTLSIQSAENSQLSCDLRVSPQPFNQLVIYRVSNSVNLPFPCSEPFIADRKR